jgi:hypothetical protein
MGGESFVGSGAQMAGRHRVGSAAGDEPTRQPDRSRTRQRRTGVSAWLGAGAVVFGVGATLACGSGLAHADSTTSAASPSSSNGAGKGASSASQLSRKSAVAATGSGHARRAKATAVPVAVSTHRVATQKKLTAAVTPAVPAASVQAVSNSSTPKAPALGVLRSAAVTSSQIDAPAASVVSTAASTQGVTLKATPAATVTASVSQAAVALRGFAQQVAAAFSTALAGLATQIERDIKGLAAMFTKAQAILATGPAGSKPVTGDSTAALQALFDGLKPGQTLTLAPGVYKHSGVLTISVPGVHINGNGATLVATNDATSALEITGDGVSVTNLNLQAPLTGPRYGLDAQNSITLEADNVTLSNINISGSAAVGVFVYGANGFTLNNITVANTRADGILVTGGSTHGVINNATTQSTGDNGIAVVSYGPGYFQGADPQLTSDIVINSPTVDGTLAHGLSVIGGKNITFNNINVSQTYAAGVYVATEPGPWYTDSVDNVHIIGGTVTGANTGPINGAVLVYAGYGASSISNVTIDGLTITGTPSTALRNIELINDAGSITGVTVTNIALKNTTLIPLYLTNNIPDSSFSASGWTLDGRPITVGRQT